MQMRNDRIPYKNREKKTGRNAVSGGMKKVDSEQRYPYTVNFGEISVQTRLQEKNTVERKQTPAAECLAHVVAYKGCDRGPL
jgi:hypothetical protein